MRTSTSIPAVGKLLSGATAILLILANCGVIRPTCEAATKEAAADSSCCMDDCCGSCDDHGGKSHQHRCAANCCLPLSVPLQYAQVMFQVDQYPGAIGIDARCALPMEPAYSIFHPPRI